MAEKEAKKAKKQKGSEHSFVGCEGGSFLLLSRCDPAKQGGGEEGGGGLVPPPSLPWPRFSSLRTRFPAFVQCHSLEIGGGEGGRNPFLEGGREGGPLLRSLSIVREQPYVLDPDSDPGGPNPDEVFAKVKTRSGYFASRLFHHFSNVGWHRASTFTQGSFALLSFSFPPAYFARTANRSHVHTLLLLRAFCLCSPRLCLGAKGKLDH